MTTNEFNPNLQIKLQIPANRQFISLHRNYFYHLLMKSGQSKIIAQDLRIVVGEVLNYIINHVYYNNSRHSILLSIQLGNNEISIEFKDRGEIIDYKNLKKFDLTDYREEGLGMFLVENLVDSIEFFNQPEGGNIIRIIKKINHHI